MTILEGGIGCSLYPCGVAAIANTVLSFVSFGDHVLITDSAYEPTQNFCKYVLSRMGVNTTWFNPMIGKNISDLIQKNTRVVILESPGSITMEVQDIPSIVEEVKKKRNSNTIIILDNTWSAGILLNALEMGVDISVQSATKYIMGHSDGMLGTAVANARCWEQLCEQSYLMGQIVDADTSYMALRGLRTLSIRLKQHEENGLRVAHWLNTRSEVERVNHPALLSCKGHNYFIRDFLGSNGLFSFILKKRLNVNQLENYFNHFQCFRMAYSWGGFESLILFNQPEDLISIRPISGIDFSGTLVRLHIGLEDVDDLINDLSDGFSRI